MPDRPDKDHLVRQSQGSPGLSVSGRGAELPTNEPGGRSLKEQRADLQRLIYELEGSLKYMGATHPQRATSEAKLAQLGEMLKHIEAELGIKPENP